MFAIVKGTVPLALKAAKERGVVVRSSIYKAATQSTHLILPSSEWSKVARWYGEESKLVEGYGYEAGTCLYFNEGSSSLQTEAR